jgi:hypothetical protein
MLKIGLGAVTQVPAVLKKDFATGALLVMDMELAALRGLRVSRLFLHPQLTEIGLAGGVRQMFTAVADRAARARDRGRPGDEQPAPRRRGPGPRPEALRGGRRPSQPEGVEDVPRPRVVRTALSGRPDPLGRREITAGGTVPPRAALAHVESLGLGTAVLDARAVDAAFRADAA